MATKKVIPVIKIILTQQMAIPFKAYSSNIVSKFREGIRNIWALSKISNTPTPPSVSESVANGFNFIRALTEVADETLRVKREVF
jgi:hypothetical protein